MSDVAERVKKIVVEHLGVDGDKVKPEASFIDDLGADSLDTVELVMAFEEEFGIEIPDDAAETIQTVGDAVKFIEKAQPEGVLVALSGTIHRISCAGAGLCNILPPRFRVERDSCMRRVVVTGLGMVSPLATGVEETWCHMLAGRIRRWPDHPLRRVATCPARSPSR